MAVHTLAFKAAAGTNGRAALARGRDRTGAHAGIYRTGRAGLVVALACQAAARAGAVADGGAGQRARLAQQVQQVVTGDGRTLADEARIGGDDVGRIRPAVDGVELAVRNAGGIGHGAHHRAARQADAGDQHWSRRGAAIAGAGLGAVELDGDVAAGRADWQFDGLAREGGVVSLGVFLAVARTRLGNRHGPRPRDGTLAARTDVVDGGTGHRERAACGDLALVIGD
ncbi:hypothetical protein ACAE110713_29720 [Achromobacter aegrifaciens]